MKRMLAVGTIAALVAVVTAFSPGSGVASPGVPAGLVNAIHARFGPGLVRFGSRAGGREPIAVFGYEVSLSADGTTALVGAPAVRADSGAAYIFHTSSPGSWASSSTPTANLSDSKGGYGAEFGVQVALSADGTTAFVGSPLTGQHGVIDVFHVPSENAWASRSTPSATLTVGHGLFVGAALAASSDGTTLIVGAPFYDFFAGGAYVFHASSESAWASTTTPTAVLSNIDESENDGFVGNAVAISGDGTTALVSDTGAPKGGAYLFHVGSESAWTSIASPTAILTKASGAARDALGNALALSGDGTTALLAAPGANGNTGAVDVFHTSSAASWVSSSAPTATLTKAGNSTDALLGYVVALSASGTTAVATAIGVGGQAGASYVFHVADESAWASSSTPAATLTNSAGVPGDALGVGLALSADGATALLGAPGSSHGVGAADVFHVSDESSWATSSTPSAMLTDSALLHAGCVVPNVKGMFLTDAKYVIKSFGCRVGEVDNAYAPYKIGRIIRQSPVAGTVLPLGSKINLVRSLGPWSK